MASLLAITEKEDNPTPMEVQERFYKEMCRFNWTKFTVDDYVFLKQKIAYALYGPPSTEGDMDRSGAVTEQNDIQGYETRQKDSINEIYQKITTYAQYNTKKEIFLSIVFVVCMRPPITKWHQHVYLENKLWEFLETKTDVVMWTIPVFAIRRCHPIEYTPGKEPCRVYIDNVGRVYNSWRAFLCENTLTKCHMLIPKDGMYSTQSGESEFTVIESPAMTTNSALTRSADVGGAGLAVGAAAAASLLAAPAVATGALVVGSVVGIYGFVRSSLSLKDRSRHHQSIDPLTDPEARGCWLNLGVSFVGVGAGAANAALKSVAQAGSGATQVGKALQVTVDTFRYANLGFSSVGLLNGIGYGIYKWSKHNEPPTALECFQLATSVLFFANSVISNKTAAEIVTETEMQTISDYRESLRSNRHRKVFDKMCKETTRTSGNIIQSIRKIGDRDEFFAGVVKMNKELNRNGVRISFAPDGRALLNGLHPVDPDRLYAAGAGPRAQLYAAAGRPAPGANAAKAAAAGPAAAPSTSGGSSAGSLLSAPGVIGQLFEGASPLTALQVGHFLLRRCDWEAALDELSRLLSELSAAACDAVLRLALHLLENLLDDAAEMLLAMFGSDEIVSRTLKFVVEFIRSQASAFRCRDSSEEGPDAGSLRVLRHVFRNGRIDRDVIRSMLSDFCDRIKSWFAPYRSHHTIDCEHCGYMRIEIGHR